MGLTERIDEIRQARGVQAAQPPERGVTTTDSERRLVNIQRTSPSQLPESQEAFADLLRKRNVRMELWGQAGFPLRHKMALDRNPVWPGTVAAEAWAVVCAGNMVALVGKRGTGKTQMATWLGARHIFESEKSVKYSRAYDLFMRMKADIGAGTEGATMAAMVRTNLLILDELQERGDTEYENRELGRLIDKRYAACLPTILIANLTPDEFAREVGSSIVSRFHEGGRIFECDWESYRAC